MGNSYKHENSKYGDIHDILDKGEKWRNEILGFRTENGRFTERRTEHTWQANSGNSETMGQSAIDSALKMYPESV